MRGARDLGTGLELKRQMLGHLASLQVHHIFPKAFLYQAGYTLGQVNAVANLCFLTQETNLAIKDEANYNAGYLLGMLAEYGGLETAHKLLAATHVSQGFLALYERGRPDLTVETLVLNEEFQDLFTDTERATARDRLAQVGYRV